MKTFTYFPKKYYCKHCKKYYTKKEFIINSLGEWFCVECGEEYSGGE